MLKCEFSAASHTLNLMASSSSRSGKGRPKVPTAKARTPHGAIGGLIGALVMSVIAGLLVTVAVTPVVAVSGAATSSTISIFENLPSTLDPGTLAQPSTLYALNSAGEKVEIATFYAQNRAPVEWDEISQFVKDAAVATEDPRFFTHNGVDIMGLGRAVVGQATGNDSGGASTITMQYVRNVLVQQAEAIPDEEEREAAYIEATKQDIPRKLQEIRYAVGIEKQYSKDQILNGYLNIALFGRAVYGIEAAAQTYYGKSAKDLSLSEAASLIAIVQFPSDLNLFDPENIPNNQDRRNYVLQRMLDAKRITQAQFDEAIATDVTPQLTNRDSGCAVAETNYGLGHFCDYVQRYIQNDPAFGNTVEERQFNFLRGGYQIMTTVNLDLQKASIDAVREAVPPIRDDINVGASAVTVEPGTGRVLAMAQNRYYNADEEFLSQNADYTSINYATDFEYGGSSGFQIGSTTKTFTLAEWLRTGHSLNETVNANGRTVPYSSFKAGCLGGVYSNTGSFTFRNYAGYQWGSLPVMRGTALSVNGVFVSMQQQLDLCNTIEIAEKLGVHRAIEQTNPDMLNYGTTDLTIVPSNTYSGIDEIAPISMAAAYAAFPNKGDTCTPVPIDSITDAEGNDVTFTKSKCTEGVSEDVAAGVLTALQNVLTGTGAHARSPIGVPRFIKTGITDGEKDYWNVGGTTKAVTAVWVGNVTGFVDLSTTGLGRPEQRIFSAVQFAGDEIFGGDAFPPAPRTMTQQVLIAVPDVKGLSYGEAEQLLTTAGFSVTNGGEVDSSVAAGRVASSNPTGEAGRASNITLYVSRGNLKIVPDGLVGQKTNSATTTLINAGFPGANITSVCATDPAPTKPAGPESQVLSVSPASGTEANPNFQVTLTVKCT